MNTPIIILLDSYQFLLLRNLKQCEVVAIGEQFIHEYESVIFHEYIECMDELTGNVIIRNGVFKELQYSNPIGTICLFLTGYNDAGKKVPLGLSGVRNSDKFDSF